MPNDSSETSRKEIFQALVALQDTGIATEPSRSQIANQFSIGVVEVQHIEREGISKKWPPLSAGDVA